MSTITKRRQATRDRLLGAAAETFVERGIAGSSVEDICDRAGFTRGAFYSNFSDRDELVIALLESQGERVRARLEELVAQGGSASELLAGVGEAWTDGGTGAARTLALEMTLHALRTPAVGRAWAEQQGRFREGVRRALLPWLEREGFTPPVDLDRMIRMLQAMFVGEIGQSVLEPEAVEPDDLQLALVDLLLRPSPIALERLQDSMSPTSTGQPSTRQTTVS